MKWLTVPLVLFASAMAEAGGWVSVPSGFASNFLGVSFAGGPGVAYAVGDSGRIQKSTDGGATWSAQVSGTTNTLLAVDFPVDANVGYAVGASGTILKTVDGGATWTPQVSGVPGNLRDVEFPVDASTGYVVGNAGVILKTTDGGANWSPLPSGTTNTLRAISFPTDALTGYIVGHFGTVLKTTNGGLTFSPSPSGTTNALHAVHFPVDATTGYAVGAAGTILKTTDSGLTWTARVSGVSTDFFGARFPSDATLGYATGDSGVLERTTDAGFNWFRQPTGSAQSLSAVDFGSATTGLAVGSSGTILRTTNGGDPSVVLHPNGAGTITNFTSAFGCASTFDCVNDQTGNAPLGLPLSNDGNTSRMLDASGSTNREMYRLVDGATPTSATVVAVEIRTAVGNGPGSGQEIALSYQRVGVDATPINSPPAAIASSCCTTTLAWFLENLTWTQADLDLLEIGMQHTAGGEVQASQIFVVVTYQSAAPVVNYRSIGTALDYSAGTVSASNGSPTIVGSATSWLAANRGRGDRIRIDGVDYTVLSVASNNVLTLTSPFAGGSGSGKGFAIARQFASLDAWEDCIDGNPCGSFPVASPSLVSDNRSEVGVVYKDSAYTLSFSVTIDGSITDDSHTITLTADGQNRHQGIAGTGVVVDNSGGSGSAVQLRDDFVTVEWIEIRGGGAGIDGIRVSNLGLPNQVVLRSLLIHDTAGDGVEFADPDLTSDVFNSIFYGATIGIRSSNALSAGSSLRLVNNTIYSCTSKGIDDTGGSPVVDVVNNIAASNTIADFDVLGLSPSSDHNLSTDSTAPGPNSLISIPLLSIGFVNTTPGSEDLHIQPTSAARGAGADMGGLFTIDVDGATRSAPWDIGADESAGSASLTISSAANQTFIVGSAVQTAATITINDDPSTPSILASKDIRIRIPFGFPMQWDPAVTTLTLGGSGSSKVDSQVLAYEDSGRTVVLDVTSDFAAGDVLAISGLGFYSFTTPASQDFLGLEVEDDGVASVFDDKSIDIFPDAVPTLSSANDQAFVVGAPGVPIATIAISEGNAPLIRAANDLRVRIPAGFNMTWNAADTSASIGGIAVPKVSPAVSYEDGNQTLVLNVLTDFVSGDFVTVSGLSFMSFTAISAADELELEVDNAGGVIDVDDKRIAIGTAVDVSVFTALATDSEVRLEWVFPAVGACNSVDVRRDFGSFPTDSTGTPVVSYPCAGLEGTSVAVGETSLSNDTDYYYAAFVNTGSGFTPGKFVKTRPFDTSGPVKWAYSTGATSMAPPGLRLAGGDTYVYIVSNDGILHALRGGAVTASGGWIAGYLPYDAGAPVQTRPPVVPFAVAGASGAAFLGSQDGRVHAVDAVDGSLEWSRSIATTVQAAPAGHFVGFDPLASDLLLVGTRNASAANSLEALDVDTGTPAWSFVNDLVQGDGEEIGIISGGASVDYGNQKVYFASRTRPGSTATLWAIDFTPTLLWNASLGNIDGSPVLYGGRIYVGNNAGVVHAVDATSGVPQWNLPLGNGAIKGFPFPKFGDDVLFVSTNDKVWAVVDNGGTGAVVPGWPVSIPSPSTPLRPPDTPHVLVGSGNGRLYQIDISSPGTPSSVVLGLGNAAVGAPTLDLINSMIYVGTDAGIIYAVSYPLP
jgi:photosystem II stability/assembly factor-like uncharacterized protein/outer membrane protein assembly factor BamB